MGNAGSKEIRTVIGGSFESSTCRRCIIYVKEPDNYIDIFRIKAIYDAYKLRKPGDGVIIHSDAGSQYTSRKYKKTLGDFHAIQSMSDVAKCYDNARMESWFATLKKEKIYKLDTVHMTVEEVKKEVWRYTFAYYNTVRITTVTEDGFPPSVYQGKASAAKSVA
jgi:putative transposase